MVYEGVDLASSRVVALKVQAALEGRGARPAPLAAAAPALPTTVLPGGI